jgi:hypothetical protein
MAHCRNRPSNPSHANKMIGVRSGGFLPGGVIPDQCVVNQTRCESDKRGVGWTIGPIAGRRRGYTGVEGLAVKVLSFRVQVSG